MRPLCGPAALKLRLAEKGIQCASIQRASPGKALVLVTAVVGLAVSWGFMVCLLVGVDAVEPRWGMAHCGWLCYSYKVTNINV
jgi:hypothetical protein